MRRDPSARSGRTAVAAIGGTIVVSLATLSAPTGVTYAAWSDSAVVHNTVSAGVWAPDPPAACGPLDRYEGVIYGTPGDDQLVGGNHRQIIMGYGGNDTLTGGNSGDCLVGGDGNDRLVGGNAKDILLGDDGDDYLDGGNGMDAMAGGAGADTCIGGNGKNVVTSCDAGTP